MFNLSYGLFVLTATDGAKDNGCITNTCSQVTSEPNQIAFAVNKANYTHDMVFKTREFNISIISEDASFDLFKHFGFQSGRDVDKFKDFTAFDRAANGIPYIVSGTNAYISGTAIDVGADVFRRGLCLPSDNKMTVEEQEVIIDIIHRCFR